MSAAAFLRNSHVSVEVRTRHLRPPSHYFQMVGHPEVMVANGAPSHHRRLPWGCGHALRTALTVLRVFSLRSVSELGTFAFFLSPIFFGLTARVIPLRSGLRVFCFHGSSPESMGPSHKADASLRLHAPLLSLVPQRKTGQKENVLSQFRNSSRVCWF